jgi:vacuolar protein sorting-associated protein 13A/C
MQLDLGKLKVKNNFSWHGDKDTDPAAVHLDILHVEVCINKIFFKELDRGFV